ncbi:MAG: NrfD/PsrC family molybdoenzyme membrane anchor subunit, partial [Bacteroidota bacterium]
MDNFDKILQPRGVQRTSFVKFLAWILPWFALLSVGLYAIYLCLAEGLFHTNMDNRFAFGLWIYLDLTIIALGAGAFFTGFLLYILRRKELKAVINSAVVIGLICYSGAVLVLMVDVGQPLRAWFTFWHPNTHSMLTEVTFCLTCYLIVLLIEYVPIVLKNRQLRQIPKFLVFEFQLHKLMPVLAGIGTFLSFFHQGSLGGLFGVLRGRPFAFREELGIWPSTFFLFVISAAAAGPSFIMLTTWLVEKVTQKRLVKPEVYKFLGKVSGTMLIVYVMLKSIDTLIWINSTSPSTGFPAFEFYATRSFGSWILFTEIVVLGLLPALVLLSRRLRENRKLLFGAGLMVCSGIMLNRFVMTIQTLALP